MHAFILFPGSETIHPLAFKDPRIRVIVAIRQYLKTMTNKSLRARTRAGMRTNTNPFQCFILKLRCYILSNSGQKQGVGEGEGGEGREGRGEGDHSFFLLTA